MSLRVAVLFLSLIAGYPADSSSQTLRCGDPNAYSIDVVRDPIRDADDVNIVQGGKVLKAIKLPGQEVNGFSLNRARKTKAGFEFSIEYGSVNYYYKQFTFICRRNKFYLSRVVVESFNKHNPETWYKKVIRVNPNLPLEKFEVTNFMREVFPKPQRAGR